MKYSDYARFAAMAGAAGTAISLPFWASQATTGQFSDRLLIAAAFALPMVFAFFGLARRRVYTAGWAVMLAVLYMGYALAEYITTGPSPGLWLTLLSSSLLFAGCALYSKLRAREGTARKPSASN